MAQIYLVFLQGYFLSIERDKAVFSYTNAVAFGKDPGLLPLKQTMGMREGLEIDVVCQWSVMSSVVSW